MNKTRLQNILNMPYFMWVLLGFSISYFCFFIQPVFFSAQIMQFFHYIPVQEPIGIDLKQILEFSKSLVVNHTPYVGGNLYPPLESLFFIPFLNLDFSLAYKLFTTINLLSYLVIAFILPPLMSKKRKSNKDQASTPKSDHTSASNSIPTLQDKQASPLLMLVFISGLFSYGFQLEIERAQYNIITVLICFLAIWIFHYHKRFRYLAYILFVLSVQLKLYPLIFIVMFVDEWQDWKNNVKRFLMLLLANFALFFVLGPRIFLEFIRSVTSIQSEPYVWYGNHSIRSFTILISEIASAHGWAWVDQYLGIVQFTLLTTVAACIFLIIFQEYRKNKGGINPYLFLACTIGSSLIPSVSHDYKVSILVTPIAILFLQNGSSTSIKSPWLRTIFIMLTLIFSTAYSSTLFSYTNKPTLLDCNLPALVTMLLTITSLYLLTEHNPKREDNIST